MILSAKVSVLDLKDTILFLQGIFFIYTLPYFLQIHCACMLCISHQFDEFFG